VRDVADALERLGARSAGDEGQEEEGEELQGQSHYSFISPHTAEHRTADLIASAMPAEGGRRALKTERSFHSS
jgi:hypothetical protein